MARQSLKNIFNLIDAEKAELSVEQSFLNDLCRSIELTDEKNSRPPSKTVKPSSMQCIRNMYYQVIGKVPDEHNANYTLIGICNSGSDIHERIQQAVIDMWHNDMDCEYINVANFVRQRGLDEYLDIVKEPDFSKKEYETKLYHKTLNMSFLCDGIIKYKNHYYILEIKTESSYKFMNRNGVDPKHYNQGIAYSVAFGLDEVIFLYINRDTLGMKSFMFNITDDMKQSLVGKIDEVDSYVKKLKTPPKPVDLPKGVCTYCAYRGTCSKE